MNIFDIPTAPRLRRDPDSSDAGGGGVLESNISHPARHFGANRVATSSIARAVACKYVFATHVERVAGVVPSRLDSNRIVASVVDVVFDQHVLARVWIDSICVVAPATLSIVGRNLDIVNVDVAAVDRVQGPVWRVAQHNWPDVKAGHKLQLHQSRPLDPQALHLLELPPPLSVPIDRATARDGDVVLLVRSNERSQPTAEATAAALVARKAIHDRIGAWRPGIVTVAVSVDQRSPQNCAHGHMQHLVAGQVQRRRFVDAGAVQDDFSAGRAATRSQCREDGGVIRAPVVRDGPKLLHVAAPLRNASSPVKDEQQQRRRAVANIGHVLREGCCCQPPAATARQWRPKINSVFIYRNQKRACMHRLTNLDIRRSAHVRPLTFDDIK